MRTRDYNSYTAILKTKFELQAMKLMLFGPAAVQQQRSTAYTELA